MHTAGRVSVSRLGMRGLVSDALLRRPRPIASILPELSPLVAPPPKC